MSSQQVPDCEEDAGQKTNLSLVQRIRQLFKSKSKKTSKLLEKDALSKLSSIAKVRIPELKDLLHHTKILGKNDLTYDLIFQYINNSSRHHPFGIEVVNIIRLIRKGDREFADFPFQHGKILHPDNYRMLLFHGTKRAFVSSIIRKGFVIPVNKNQMFGRGVYFSDRFSKSAQHCDDTEARSYGFIFLCDVKLGRVFKSLNSHNEFTQPPTGFDTVKGLGQWIPDWDKNMGLRGSLVPSGPTVQNNMYSKYSLNFNEYVVYNAERIKPKYLIQIKFK